MALSIGQPRDHSFDEPLGLLSDCHRRIEHFLHVLEVIANRTGDAPLTAVERADLDTAVTYFATAAPKHTADEEQSLFPRLRASGDPGARQALDVITRLERDHSRADAHHRAVECGDSIGTVSEQRHDFFQWPQVKLAVRISHAVRAVERRAMADRDHHIV